MLREPRTDAPGLPLFRPSGVPYAQRHPDTAPGETDENDENDESETRI